MLYEVITAGANIPMVPGTPNLSQGDAGVQEALAFASEYGYPIMLKATAGGGGRGISRIEKDSQMKEQIPMARAEANAAFNNDNVYLEKVVLNPKHVEVQVIADSFGDVVHLGTRDPSSQICVNQEPLNRMPMLSAFSIAMKFTTKVKIIPDAALQR